MRIFWLMHRFDKAEQIEAVQGGWECKFGKERGYFEREERNRAKVMGLPPKRAPTCQWRRNEITARSLGQERRFL